MPVLRRRKTDPEDAPIGDPAAEPSQDPRVHYAFTRELLDLALYALEAVIRHPLVKAHGDDSAKHALLDAYKKLDRLHPLTLVEVHDEEVPAAEDVVLPGGSPLVGSDDEVG